MKAWGWVFVVIGSMSFVCMFLALASDYPERSESLLSNALMFGLLGAYMLSRAKKKDEDEHNRDKWMNNEG